MGCDYYIVKALEIDFAHGVGVLNDKRCNRSTFSQFIDLERNERYYYDFNLDEDDPNYDKLEREHIQNILKSRMEPILIYDGEEFKSKNLELKYKEVVEKELLKCEKTWKDVRKICKIEYRYERE